jgi:hypothetical protein
MIKMKITEINPENFFLRIFNILLILLSTVLTEISSISAISAYLKPSNLFIINTILSFSGIPVRASFIYKSQSDLELVFFPIESVEISSNLLW